MGNLAFFDYVVLALYGLILLGMGFYFARKMKTAGQFMTANGKIPGWAAGLAVMSAYTSSISYIATPGKAFDSDWHPIIFSLCMIPVSWLAVVKIIPLYRKLNLISVYSFLEERLGSWARLYAAFSFLLFMVGRMAVILYLVALLIQPFIGGNLIWIIIAIGFITILYTLMGGVEAVIWTDVMQSIVMIAGIIYTVVFLGNMVFISSPELFSQAYDTGKFSWGLSDFSFDKRTIWVMIIYGLTENLRNLLANWRLSFIYFLPFAFSLLEQHCFIFIRYRIPCLPILPKETRFFLILLLHKCLWDLKGSFLQPLLPRQ